MGYTGLPETWDFGLSEKSPKDRIESLALLASTITYSLTNPSSSFDTRKLSSPLFSKISTLFVYSKFTHPALPARLTSVR